MTLSVTYSCRAALARTLACPRPPLGPPPLCPPPGCAGPRQTRLARPAPARTKLAPAAAWAPRGLHARLGPRWPGDRGLAGPGPPSVLPAQAGAPPGGGGAPGEPRDAWVLPRPCRRRGALAPAGVNPSPAASRRSHPRSTPQPPPPPAPPPARCPPPPPARCPAPSPGPLHSAGAARSPSPRPPPRPALPRRGGGGLPEDWQLGRATMRPAARWGTEGRARAPRAPGASPLPLARRGAYLPESRPWERGSIS